MGNPPPSHDAFTARLAAKLPGKVACVDAWRQADGADAVLAGLADGTLMILRPPEASGNAADAADTGALGSWSISRAFRSFAGARTLIQLQVASSRSLLLSLGDQGVSVHRLPAFQLSCQASLTRYGKCFAWDDGRAMLAVAVKRRLHLLHYDGSDFVELKEVALPHSPLHMQWLGNSIALAYKSSYAIFNAETTEQTPLPGFGKDTKPALAVLGSSEVIASLDNQSQVFGIDGKATRRGLQWSSYPAALLHCQPYVAALLPSCIEVRSLRAASGFRALQSISSPTLAAPSPSPSSDGSIFAVAAAEVWQLRPLPLQEQARQLASQGRCEEALDLCSLCSFDRAEDRRALEDELHIQFGHQLFEAGVYEEAMVHFGMCSAANPVVLLRLFPSLAPAGLLKPVLHLFPDYKKADTVEPEGEDYTGALNMLLPYLLSWRTRLTAADSAVNSGEDGAAPTAADGGSRPGSGRGGSGADRQHSGSSVEDGAPPTQAPDLQQLSAKQRRHLAVLLDTALLKAMLALSDTGHLLRFVQRDNVIDLKEGQKALDAAGRYSELVALFQARSRHDQALDLIRRLSQDPDALPHTPTGAAKDLAGMPGVWAAVKYIRAMGPSEIDLIRAHARWILRQDPEAGIDMFAQMEPAVAPDVVLPILQADAPHLAVPYLESALAAGSATHSRFDNELAIKYLELVLRSQTGDAVQPAGTVSADVALDRLKTLVASSQHIDADRLLRLVPPGALLEVRALLLERFGRHREILQIYVDELRKPHLAEAYCDRVYSKGGAQAQQRNGLPRPGAAASEDPPGAVYLQLIKVFLDPPTRRRKASGGTEAADAAGAVSQRYADMAAILARRHDRIDAVHALSLIPDQMPLAAVLPFLHGALQGGGEAHRHTSIVRSLRKSGNLQTRAALVAARQRSVVITGERNCSICFKRIGTTAFVSTAGGAMLQHFSCYKRGPQTEALAYFSGNGSTPI